MLILTRRTVEAIHIGDKVTVTVLNVQDNPRRLGIDAPIDVAVHREEIYLRIKQQSSSVTREKAQTTP